MRPMTFLRLRSLLPPAACLLALALVCALLIPFPASFAQPDQLAQPDPSAMAQRLPPLPVVGGEVNLPLGGSSPFSWVAIAGGPATEHPKGHLLVQYTITPGQPAGAALIFRPGTLAGLDHIDIEIRGNRSTQLVPTLRNSSGSVYRFPAVPVQVGSPRLHRLSAADMQYFPGQAEGPDSGSFDPAEAILLSLVDISAFTGAVPAGTEMEWTVSKLTAVLGGESQERGMDKAEKAEKALAPTGSSSTTAATTTHLTPVGEGRQPRSIQAEARFFEVFNGGSGGQPLNRAAAIDDLKIALLSDPSDPRTTLLLGLNYLWLAAEGDRTDLRTVDHLILAEHFLGSAQHLAPDDQRIPSWLVPTRQGLARLNRDAERAKELDAELVAAYAEDPNFHSFSVAMAGFGSRRGSERFTRGLQALRSASTTCPDDDPSCQNDPRWPHNIEGFLTFRADYELKAGNPAAARQMLELVQSIPGFTTWPYRGEVEDRLSNLALYTDLYANNDPTDDPAGLISGSGHSCQVCHRAE